MQVELNKKYEVLEVMQDKHLFELSMQLLQGL